jgi:CheY-like chemotaxis protein
MSRTVLYIDDNEDNVRLVERVLRRLPGVELREARTGWDGVKAAIGDRPDLILLDNRLPDINAKQVMGELAAVPAAAAIPVIVLSGDSARSVIDDLLAAGAVEFLTKPLDIHQLVTVIERHLG